MYSAFTFINSNHSFIHSFLSVTNRFTVNGDRFAPVHITSK